MFDGVLDVAPILGVKPDTGILLIVWCCWYAAQHDGDTLFLMHVLILSRIIYAKSNQITAI